MHCILKWHLVENLHNFYLGEPADFCFYSIDAFLHVNILKGKIHSQVKER